MPKLRIAFSFVALAWSSISFAADGCGDGQVCTYKGQLKAGQACPASFCQGAYSDGLKALANGGVLRIIKKAELVEPAKEAPKAEPAPQWKDPPSRAPKAVVAELPDPTSTRSAEITSKKCHNYKLMYADLPQECKTVLDLEALGMRGDARKGEQFCQNAYAGDTAGIDRCLGRGGVEMEIDANSLIGNVLRAKANANGTLEKVCRRKYGANEEAVQRCAAPRAVIQGRGVAGKAAPKVVAPVNDGGNSSMDVQSAE